MNLDLFGENYIYSIIPLSTGGLYRDNSSNYKQLPLFPEDEFPNLSLEKKTSEFDRFKLRYTLSDLFFLWARGYEVSVTSNCDHDSYNTNMRSAHKIRQGKQGNVSEIIVYNRGRNFRRYVICIAWDNMHTLSDYVQGWERKYNAYKEDTGFEVSRLEELFTITNITPLSQENVEDSVNQNLSYLDISDLFPELIDEFIPF